MSKTNEDNILPADQMNSLKRKDQVRSIMNDLQMNLEPKVEIKYDSWKNIINNKNKEEDKLSFSLFDGYIQKPDSNKDVVKNTNENTKITTKPQSKFNLFEDNVQKKNSELNKGLNKVLSKEEKEKEEKLLLKKKRNRDKKKLKEKQSRQSK